MSSPTGFEWNPNNLAVTLLIISPFFLLHSNKWIKYFGFFSIFILIVISGSRGVYCICVYVAVVYFVFEQKRFLLMPLFCHLFLLISLSSLETFKNSENPRIREMANSLMC